MESKEVESLLNRIINKAKEVGRYSGMSGFDAAYCEHHAGEELNKLKIQLLSLVNSKPSEHENTAPVSTDSVDSQENESLEGFSREERTVNGGHIISRYGQEVPFSTPFGVRVVKIFGIRRINGRIRFGIGFDRPRIIGWVTADHFSPEWPD